MKQKMRRVLWDLYAWPITLLFALSVIMSLAKIETSSVSNIIITVPALIALHLHIRKRNFLSADFWKFYAFFYVAWDFIYCLLIRPAQEGVQINSSNALSFFLPLIICIPLYTAVFLYAFRDRNKPVSPDAMEGKSFAVSAIRIMTIVVSALIVFSIFYLSYKAFILHRTYSTPGACILPMERNIAYAGNQPADNVKISYENLVMEIPFKIIEQKCYHPDSEFKTASVKIAKGKGISISRPMGFSLKGIKGKGITFDAYSKILYMTPDQVNPFIPTEKDRKNSSLLVIKATEFSLPEASGSIYKFTTPGLRGFQFNRPNKKINNVLIFDRNENRYEITFVGFSQEEIDYVLSSIRVNYTTGGKAVETIKGIRIGDCVFTDKALAEEYKKASIKLKSPLSRD